MAFQNQALLNAINNLPSTPEAINALNEIIKSNLNPVTFRQAIIDNASFWQQKGVVVPNNASSADNNFLAVEGADPTQGIASGANSFLTLRKLAIEKRIQLSLQALDVQGLSDLLTDTDTDIKLRNKLVDSASKKTRFGNPQVVMSDWDANTASILDASALIRIKKEAQRQLLLHAINACTNQTSIQYLLQSVQTNFSNALGGLNIPPAIASSFDYSLLNDEMKKKAAKIGLSLEISLLPDELIKAFSTDALSCKPENFKGFFTINPLLNNLAQEDIPAIQSELGSRYLTYQLAQYGADKTGDLETIASSANKESAIYYLKSQSQNNNYVSLAINDQSFPKIREAAAKQALKHKISQCEDKAALDALISASNNQSLKKILASHQALGYTNKQAFREAFTQNSVGDIAVLAHIQKNLAMLPDDVSTNDHLSHLKELIKKDTFFTQYSNRFCQNASQTISNSITQHFTKPENIQSARQIALMTYLKRQLKSLENKKLQGIIINPKDLNQILGDDRATDLLEDPLAAQIKAYAQAEIEIRNSKKIDLSVGNNYESLINKINLNEEAAASILSLPEKEKHVIQARLTQNLVKNYPQNKNHSQNSPVLEKIGLATDPNTFKTELAKLGINNLDWVQDKTKDEIEQIQKAACTQAIKLDVNNNLRFGPKAHPALIQLVETLPLNQQQALLSNKPALHALTDAQDVEEVRRILGKSQQIDETIAENLIKENKHLAQIARIANPAIVKILASVDPATLKNGQITDSQIATINERLISLRADELFTVIPIPGATTRMVIKEICDTLSDNPADLYRALGLTAAGGLNPDGSQAQNDITTQDNYNKNLKAKYGLTGTSTEDQAILTGFFALTKAQAITDDQIFTAGQPNAQPEIKPSGLLEDFKNSSSAAEFIKKARDASSKYANVFPAGTLEAELTPQTFKALKRQARQAAIKDPKTFEFEFKVQKDEIKERRKLFKSAKLGMFKGEELENLGKALPIYMLNPAFGAMSKEYAKQLGSNVRQLAQYCNLMERYFDHETALIKEQIEGLPPLKDIKGDYREKIKSGIEKQKNDLNRLLNEMQEERKRYQGILKLLNGDPGNNHPVLEEGILKSIEKAERGQYDLYEKIFGTLEPKDYPLSEKSAHFDKTWKGDSSDPANSGTQLIIGGDREKYASKKLVETDKFREYTIISPKNNNEIKGCFIEERGPKNLAGQLINKEMKYLPSIKLTMNRFPSEYSVGNTKPSAEELDEARMNYAMAMVFTGLNKLSSPPSEDNPLVLRGSNPQELEYLWVAAMLIGKNDPNMKFDHKAIVSESVHFNPENQIGMLGKVKSELYKKHEKGNVFTMKMKDIKKFHQQKFGHPEARKEFVKEVENLTNHYKTGLKTAMDDVKKQVAEPDSQVIPAPSIGKAHL